MKVKFKDKGNDSQFQLHFWFPKFIQLTSDVNFLQQMGTGCTSRGQSWTMPTSSTPSSSFPVFWLSPMAASSFLSNFVTSKVWIVKHHMPETTAILKASRSMLETDTCKLGICATARPIYRKNYFVTLLWTRHIMWLRLVRSCHFWFSWPCFTFTAVSDRWNRKRVLFFSQYLSDQVQIFL